MKTKVLMVEDDLISVALFKAAAKHMDDFEFDFATSFRQAKSLLDETPFQVVLLDLGLPDSQGIETFHDLHKYYSTAAYIIMSGDSDEKVVEQALQMGAQDYLVKGKLRFSELPRQIHYALDRFTLVSQLANSHRELIDSHQRFEAVFENQTDGIMVVDSLGEVIMKNKAAKVRADIEFIKRIKEKIKTIPEGDKRLKFDYEFNKNEGVHYAMVEAQIIPWDHHDAHLIAIRDITELVLLEKYKKEAELQVRQTQKLESIGQLAAGVAHEINTPSQYVCDNLEFLDISFSAYTRLYGLFSECLQFIKEQKQIKPASASLLSRCGDAEEEEEFELLFTEIPAAISQAREGINHVTRIVKSLKDFSHSDNEDKVYTELDKRIASTITVCRNEWKYCAEVEMDMEPDMEPIRCHSGQICQVVMNLVVNAAHAIEDRQKKEGDTSKGSIRISYHSSDEGWVEIQVADNGCGIPDDIRERIFDPFFTTKEVGRGTGQGLAMIHNIIIKKHEGHMDFESTPGLGTTFSIRLPR